MSEILTARLALRPITGEEVSGVLAGRAPARRFRLAGDIR
jgi:hypothetical protein